MKANKKETGHKSSKIKGKGLLNKLIDKLPVEFHLPTYSYCGPGTKRVRFVRGDLPKNTLDEACRTHDIAYFDKDSNTRHQADIKLKNRAKEIYKDSNKKVSERGAAWLVNKAMAIKTNIGAGHQRQKVYKILYFFYKKVKKQNARKIQQTVLHLVAACVQLKQKSARQSKRRLIILEIY